MIDENKLIDDLNKKAKEFDDECGRLLNKSEFQEAYRCAGKTLGIVSAMEIVKTQEIMEIPFSRAENKWIPCSERFPEDRGTYIVNAIENHIVHVTFAKWMPRMKRWNLTGSRSYWKVTAWMPLPEPYRPEAHERKKQTNADKIRNMTDEEMADFLMDISIGMLFDKKIMNVKYWLQSESEE